MHGNFLLLTIAAMAVALTRQAALLVRQAPAPIPVRVRRPSGAPRS